MGKRWVHAARARCAAGLAAAGTRRGAGGAPASGCTSQDGPRQLTVINQSPDEKQITEINIDGSPSPLFGVNEYLAPGHEMVFPTLPYAIDPEHYTATPVGIWHPFLYRVRSCNQMTIVFRQ